MASLSIGNMSLQACYHKAFLQIAIAILYSSHESFPFESFAVYSVLWLWLRMYSLAHKESGTVRLISYMRHCISAYGLMWEISLAVPDSLCARLYIRSRSHNTLYTAKLSVRQNFLDNVSNVLLYAWQIMYFTANLVFCDKTL